MIFNIALKISLGRHINHTVTDMDGVKSCRSLQAIYETSNFTGIGYIGKRPSRVWAAYSSEKQEIGLYTSREAAIHYAIRAHISG